MYYMHCWNFSNVIELSTSCIFSSIFLIVSRCNLSAIILSCGIENIHRGQGQVNSKGYNHFNFQKSEIAKQVMCEEKHTVMVEKSIVVLPLLWMFAPDSLSQLLQNLTGGLTSM